MSHSAILVFSKDPKCEVPCLDFRLEDIQSLNYCADYIKGMYTEEEVKDYFYGDCYLKRILPKTLCKYHDGALAVVDNCKEAYNEWMCTHIGRVRDWQDTHFNRSDPGAMEYYLREVNVVTESEDEDEWAVTDYIFYNADENHFSDYLSFIDDLPYYKGETLHLIGVYDYHF